MGKAFDTAMRRAQRQLRIKPGDICESCSYPPVLCLGIGYKNDDLWGVSLIDGSFPRSCSLVHCGVRKPTPKQAWAIKRGGPEDPEEAARIPGKARWWKAGAEDHGLRVGLIGPKPPKRKP